MPPRSFDLQGHRGARGLRPENTLPSFEAALDHGVDSIETDLHLTRDGVAVLCHEPLVVPGLWTPVRTEVPPLDHPVLVAGLTLEQFRLYRAATNPAPQRFPRQDAAPTPLALDYSREHDFDPHAVPTLSDLFQFVAAYAGEPGRQVGKTEQQRRQASRVRFDLELKRVPFHPETIGDHFDGSAPARLEERVVAAVHAAGVLGRTGVRSFDHRCVQALLHLESGLTGGVLLGYTACVDPVALTLAAGARDFCPSYEYLDLVAIPRLHEAGIRVLPWTVNEPAHWLRLFEAGVDGMTTDDPDRLRVWLGNRGFGW
jgi:glycerophosphoryl diester phosphodiesterase